MVTISVLLSMALLALAVQPICVDEMEAAIPVGHIIAVAVRIGVCFGAVCAAPWD
jgi:hypothetical protein